MYFIVISSNHHLIKLILYLLLTFASIRINMNDLDLSYIINELGEDRDEYFRAVAPPIIQSSNFAFKTVDELRKSFEDEYSTWLYSRGLNPTVEILRKKLAALDGAEDCLVFNSGAAAIFASVLVEAIPMEIGIFASCLTANRISLQYSVKFLCSNPFKSRNISSIEYTS